MMQGKLKYTKILTPLAKLILKCKITPNMLTTVSWILGLSSAYFLFKNDNLFIILFLLHLFFDMLDGSVARIGKKQTKFGKWYDPVMDQIIMVAFIIQVWLQYSQDWMLIFIFIYLIHHISYFLSEFKTPILYARTYMTIMFILQFYIIGLIGMAIITCTGVLLQIIYLIKNWKQIVGKLAAPQRFLITYFLTIIIVRISLWNIDSSSIIYNDKLHHLYYGIIIVIIVILYAWFKKKEEIFGVGVGLALIIDEVMFVNEYILELFLGFTGGGKASYFSTYSISILIIISLIIIIFRDKIIQIIDKLEHIKSKRKYSKLTRVKK